MCPKIDFPYWKERGYEAFKKPRVRARAGKRVYGIMFGKARRFFLFFIFLLSRITGNGNGAGGFYVPRVLTRGIFLDQTPDGL